MNKLIEKIKSRGEIQVFYDSDDNVTHIKLGGRTFTPTTGTKQTENLDILQEFLTWFNQRTNDGVEVLVDHSLIYEYLKEKEQNEK